MKSVISQKQFLAEVFLKTIIFLPVYIVGLALFSILDVSPNEKNILNASTLSILVVLATWHTCLKSDIRNINQLQTALAVFFITISFPFFMTVGVAFLNKDPIVDAIPFVAVMISFAIGLFHYVTVTIMKHAQKQTTVQVESNSEQEANLNTNIRDKESLSFPMFLFGFFIRVGIVSALFAVIINGLVSGNFPSIDSIIANITRTYSSSNESMQAMISSFVSGIFAYALVGLYVKKNYKLPASADKIALAVFLIQVMYPLVVIASTGSLIIAGGVLSSFSVFDVGRHLLVGGAYAVTTYFTLRSIG